MNDSSNSATRRGRTGVNLALLIAGLVSGLAPVVLFVVAAFSGLGPASASAAFAAPVLLSTALAVVAGILLARRGARGWALAVGYTALGLGVLSYAAWIYLATLGISFGDGPL